MALPWCEQEGLLHSIYAFSHKPFSTLQTAEACAGVADMCKRFVGQLAEEHIEGPSNGVQRPPLWPGLAPSDLRCLAAAASFVCKADSVLWMPKYCAALLLAPPGEPDIQPEPGCLSLLLVALDSWRFTTHSTDSGDIQHVAVCGGSEVLPCGLLPSHLQAAFQSTLAAVLAKVANRKGDARSAAMGKQGHQMTPAMMRAAVLQALEQTAADAAAKATDGASAAEVPERVPQGALTDVGLHTGGEARNIAWPLVREALKTTLACVSTCRCNSPDLFPLAEAHLHLWLLQRQVALVGAGTATSTTLNAAMQMLTAVTSGAADLAMQGHDVSHLEEACMSARRALQAAQAARMQAAAAAAQLPQLCSAASSPCSPGSYRLPRGVLPAPALPQAAEGGLEAAKEREGRNLGTLPLPSAQRRGSCSTRFADLLAVLRSAELQRAGDVAQQHKLCMVERELFQRAAGGFAHEAGLPEAEVDALVEVINVYLAALHAFQQAGGPRMQVELRSRGMLVCWSALCMVHAAAGRAHPLLLEYGVGIDWRELRHLVLSDKPAVDALLGVAAYLRRHTAPGKGVFTLADGAQATFELARQFAGMDSQLKRVWQQEQEAAVQRREAHWEVVRAKQARAAELRVQLAQDRAAWAAASTAEAAEEAKYAEKRATDIFGQYKYDGPVRHAALMSLHLAQSRTRAAQQAASCTQSALDATLKPPEPVIQPLPEHAETAAPWLFFLYMPPLLRHLERMTFLAQQLLLPQTAEVLEAVAAPAPKTFLVDHYNRYQASPYLATAGRSGSDGSPDLVRLFSSGEVPRADKVKLPTVDNYSSEHHGVWHPDELPLRLGWRGSGGAVDGVLRSAGWINPWVCVLSSLLVESFTERLPASAAALQWAMAQHGSGAATAADRGGIAVARQDERPHWISKPGYLELGALRAYPLTQFRQLCGVLRTRSLPLGQPAVQVLLRQLLYHVGQLTDSEQPTLLWRTEWEGEGGVLCTLHEELASLAAQLEHSPREHSAVLLLGEVAAFLSAWHPPLRHVARRFAAAAERWAEALEAAAQEAQPDDARPLRAKQCLLRMIALLCHAGGQLDTADVASVLSLAVMVHHGSFYGEGDKLQAQLAELKVLCHWTLVRRMGEILSVAQHNPSVLTTALRRVLTRAPAQLDWQPLTFVNEGHPTASFRATGSDSRLYSINCLDGTVLEDGAPPGRLPREVLEHPLFVRSFGSWGFEVSVTTAGVRRAIAPVRGRYYEFYLAGQQGDQLVVVEEEEHSTKRLQLLDPGQDHGCRAWGAELPVRLRELHSHWLNREDRVMVLRPPHFRKHRATFLLLWAPPPAGSPSGSTVGASQQSQLAQPVEYVCLRVPKHLSKKQGWAELLSDQHRALLSDQLVLHDSQVVRVLTKFEQPHFIHTYIPAAASQALDCGNSPCDSAGTSEKQPVGSAGRMLFELPRYALHFELRGDSLVSLEHSGSYTMAPCQQLWQPAAELAGHAPTAGTAASARPSPGSSSSSSIFTLPDFNKYLVLQHTQHQPGRANPQQRRLVVVPAGQVVRREGEVALVLSGRSGDNIQCYEYEVHPRFGHLCATTIPARLQLAALYAATGSLLPEPLSCMTGAQLAMRLVRQSWGVRPLQAEDVSHLQNAARLAGHMAAGLRLLCHELLCSSSQLNALHFPAPAPVPDHCHPPALNPEWCVAYNQERRCQLGSFLNPRLLLAADEERRAGGQLSAADGQPLWRRLQLYQPVEVPPCPVEAEAVGHIEAELLKLAVLPAEGTHPQNGRHSAVPEYPLPVGGAGSEGIDSSSSESAGVGSGSSGADSSEDGSCSDEEGSGSRDDVEGSGEGSAEEVSGTDGMSTTPLERAMHAELQDSWRVHHSLPAPEGVMPGALQIILQTQGAVAMLRKQAKAYLASHLAAVPPSVGMPGTSWRLHQASGAAPEHGSLDLLALALPRGQKLALELNPFLSDKSTEQLQHGARVWLQLCVLEDRMQRLAQLAEDPSATQHLIQELLVHRKWDVDEHPEWLVFEAEQQLQIRPTQHWVATHLLKNPGHIVQLNMGEGKTRVILPMLILCLADGHNLVRLNLLPALLDEAYSHLHSCLCASVLRCKLFVQPFHRDVQVTPATLAAMRASLAYCQQAGGVLLTSPERRLSLLLKRQELWQRGKAEACAGLDALADLPYMDLLDESDELLRHIYQLIYADGAPTELPHQQARARAGQALLHVVSSESGRPGSPLGAVLCQEGVAVGSGPGPSRPGAFRGVRLLPGEALDRALPMLRGQLAAAVLADPPHMMRWMRGHSLQDTLLRCITDPSVDASAELAAAKLCEEELADVLALRGLLACGVLEHCLQMRHLVDYGVNDRKPLEDGPTPAPPGSLGPPCKRLAVPYRAAHVPSERSEYAQPDSALTLTTLAYYHRGLHPPELLEALQALLRLGDNAQRSYYAEWFRLAAADAPAAELEPLDDVAKLDTTNSEQMARMHRLFSHNCAAVNFFLNFCVFPGDTRQFPYRLVATAWNLADNPAGRVVGFSGTNDNHRLLPLQVRQHLEVEPGLRATNGKMLAVLLANPQYHTLEVPHAQGAKAWKELLRFAVGRRFDAVVDCGALLAGTTNSAAADFLLPLLDRGRFRGVCYHDEAQGEWVVCDLQGKRLPCHRSPIRESQALTLFDEARCRGTDLQLRPDAVALLTLGPATCKDKLMQAAGRMRKLGKGQQLQIIGTPDVTAKIARVAGVAGRVAAGNSSSPHGSGAAPQEPQASSAAACLTSRHVLAWAMANTLAATQRGVVEWAHQGLQFAATRGAPDHMRQPEVLDLASMYGCSRSWCPVPKVVEAQHAKRQAQRADLAGDMLALMGRVAAAGRQLGAGHRVVAQGGLGEECERELEREEEEEKEVEKQVARVEAAAEADWPYAKALGAASLVKLLEDTGMQVVPLGTSANKFPQPLAARVHPAAVGNLPWSPLVFCTPNFVRAVQQAPGEALNEYLRPVGHLILLPLGFSGQNACSEPAQGAGSASNGGGRCSPAAPKADRLAVVMLTEREANGLLEAMWGSSGSMLTQSIAGIARSIAGSKPASGGSGMQPLLTTLCYACAAQPQPQDGKQPDAEQLSPRPRLAASVRGGGAWRELGPLAAELRSGAFMPQLVSLQLWEGETTYVPGDQQGWEQLAALPRQLAELRKLVSGHGAAAEALVGMRGKQVLLSRSQLERACDRY